ncbi:MAG: hypothetical protein ISR59_06015 [Anaerolineales bacterium]|nr:hypothetical protein [Anaerolineales bacterium]
MSEENIEITKTKMETKTAIIVAFIGVVGIVIGAILGPLVEKWMNGLGEEKAPVYLPIEEIPQKIFPYAGNDNPNGGWSTLWLIYDEEKSPAYKFEYNLPVDKYGHAGLAFQFDEPQNLDAYSAVEFTIQFSEADGRIDFFIKDNTDKNAQMQVVAKGTGEAVIQYRFSNFPGIEFSAIKEIGLNVDTTVITGNYRLEIKDIHFVE